MTIAALLCVPVLWVAVFRPIWDVDIFWHIVAGRWIWEHAALPTTDVFSAADPTRPWYTFQWLYEVVVYFLDDLGGLLLIRLVSSLLVISAFVVFFRRLRTYIGPTELVLFLMSLLVVLYSDRIRVRPHIVNFLFMAIFLPLFLQPRRHNQPIRTLITRVAILVGLWANLHAGGALMFLVTLLAVPIGEIGSYMVRNKPGANREAPRIKETCLLWFVVAAVAAIMPHFVTGNVQAITMLEASRPLIDEWMSPWGYIDRFLELSDRGKTVYSLLLTGIAPYCAFLSVTVTALVLLVRRGVAGVVSLAHPTEWLFALGTSLIAMSSARFAWWSILSFAVVVRVITHPPLSRSVRIAALVGTLVLSGVAWQRYFTSMAGSFASTLDTMHHDIDEPRFPTTAADFLETAAFSGDIWCLPNWGGYLLWRLHPQVRVLSDGRGNFDQTVGEELLLVYEQRFRSDAYDAVSSAYARFTNIDAIVIQPPGFGNISPPSLWKTVLKTRREEIYYRIRPENQANIDRAEKLLEEIGRRHSGRQ
ncbi:MAG: hypothetical protein HUU55_05965 [Myxococcales bacterium]|nr:hypothetical protein [Myxococcales bacterium]